MVRRHELTDEQWQVVEPLLPVSGAKGRPRVDDRRVINGMLFKAKTGVAWRDLPGLRDADRFDAWLHRLVVRSCVREAVRMRRVVSNLRVLPLDLPAPTDDFLSFADRDQLERGFRRLDPEQRAILALRHYAGYEPVEIAEILGIPAGTARSRLHHAHRAMRAALEADARVPAIGGQLG